MDQHNLKEDSSCEREVEQSVEGNPQTEYLRNIMINIKPEDVGWIKKEKDEEAESEEVGWLKQEKDDESEELGWLKEEKDDVEEEIGWLKGENGRKPGEAGWLQDERNKEKPDDGNNPK